MGSPGSYRSYKPGGIQKVDRLLPPVNGEPTDRRMTFAEAIDLGGLDLRVAAENYLPSKSKDITEDRLRACANAGLTQYEVAKGFGATQPTISYHAGKWRIKFDGPTPEKKAWSKKGAAKIMARVVEEEPDTTGSIEADQLARKDVAEFERRKPGLIVNEEFEAEFVKIDAEIAKTEPPEKPDVQTVNITPAINVFQSISAEQFAASIKASAAPLAESLSRVAEHMRPATPPADEYTLVFGKQDTLPVLIVKADGTVCIKNCEMDITLRYVVCFRSDFKGVKVADDKCGREFKPDGKRFQFACIDIPRSLTAAGIELPARYRLDIEEMTGVLL